MIGSFSLKRCGLRLALGVAAWLLAGCNRYVYIDDTFVFEPVAYPSQAPRPQSPVSPKPVVKVLDLGKTVQGRTLVLYLFDGRATAAVPPSSDLRATDGPATVLVLGGIHGNEPTSEATAWELVEHLKGNPSLWRGQVIAVLPSANPDGQARNTRTNAHGVDVNRNFPARNWKRTAAGPSYGGAQPAGEPETQAIVRVIETLRPRTIISIHSITSGGPCNNYDGPAEALATIMGRKNGYPVKASIGYPTPGSLGSWAGIDRETPIVTLELPRDLPGDRCWQQNREALLSALAGSATDAPVLAK
jgi:protein MpaA